MKNTLLLTSLLLTSGVILTSANAFTITVTASPVDGAPKVLGVGVDACQTQDSTLASCTKEGGIGLTYTTNDAQLNTYYAFGTCNDFLDPLYCKRNPNHPPDTNVCTNNGNLFMPPVTDSSVSQVNVNMIINQDGSCTYSYSTS